MHQSIKLLFVKGDYNHVKCLEQWRIVSKVRRKVERGSTTKRTKVCKKSLEIHKSVTSLNLQLRGLTN